MGGLMMSFDPVSYAMGAKSGGGGGIDPSDATATEGDILSPKTAYTAQGKKTGTIQSKSAATYYPSASDQTIASGQYLSGAQTIKAVTYDGLSAGNIKKDVVVKIGDASDDDRIVSVTGTYEGGGGSAWTKIAEQDFTVSTTSTSATAVGTISCGAAAWTAAKMLYVRVRDKAGKRNGYYYGGDSFLVNTNPANNSTGAATTFIRYCLNVNTSGLWGSSSSALGIYPTSLSLAGDITMSSAYSSSSTRTIDGTYHVEVYTLEWPDNVSPFA